MKRSALTRLVYFAAALFTTVGLTAQTPVPDWYLQQNQTGNNNWNSVTSSITYQFWADAPVVSPYTGNEGRYATAMDANAVYFVGGTALVAKDVRTIRPEDITGGIDTFAGGTLILGAYGNLLHRGNASTVAVVENLIAQNGSGLRSGQAFVQNLNITHFAAESGTVTFNSSANRGFNLAITNLTGAADIVFTAGGSYNLNIANTAGYSGDMSLTAGSGGEVSKLGFLADLVIVGGLTINTGTTVNLTHSVSVSALTVAGDSFAEGTYDFDYLSANYGGIFTAGDSLNGQIIVGSTIPESSAFALLAGGLVLGAVAFRRRRG